MDTTIAYQLMEGQTTSFTTDGVEGRDNNGLRRIVYNNFHTTGSLQCTDVTSLTTNNTTFHIIVIDMEDTDRVFYSSLCCYTLDGLDDNLLCLCIGIEFSLIHYLVDITGSSRLCLILHGFNQTCLCILSTQAGYFLQLLTFLHLHLLQFLILDGKQFLLVIDTCLQVVKFVFTTTKFFLTLIKGNLTLLQTVLTLLNLLVTLLYLLLQLAFLVKELLLDLKEFLFLNHFGFLFGRLYCLIIFSLNDKTENQKSA